MAGFKEFILRGNLVEIAVAFIIAQLFATVTTTFTSMVMSIIGKVLGSGIPDFGKFEVAGILVGPFLNAVIAFVLTAAVVYFGIVKPYELLKDKFKKPTAEEEAAVTSEALLAEIRDLLQAQSK
jgi:large conductance mechanosensitive channel